LIGSSLDRAVERWVVEHRVGWLDWLFVDLSRIGSIGLVWILIGLLLAFRRRRPEIAVLVGGAAITGILEASLLKTIVGRARPHEDPLVPLPHTHSFPSGHAASSFAAATVLARLEPRFRAWFFLLATAIAASRVYLGVHWPSDVLAGALLGTVTALLLLAGVRRGRRRAPPGG
jgi:undecaprenyl-diphosphatase